MKDFMVVDKVKKKSEGNDKCWPTYIAKSILV